MTVIIIGFSGADFFPIPDSDTVSFFWMLTTMSYLSLVYESYLLLLAILFFDIFTSFFLHLKKERNFLFTFFLFRCIVEENSEE